MPWMTSSTERLPAALGLGEEPLLQVTEPRLQLAHDLLAVGLVAGEAGRGVRVEVAEAEAGSDPQRVGPGDRLHRLVLAGLRGLLGCFLLAFSAALPESLRSGVTFADEGAPAFADAPPFARVALRVDLLVGFFLLLFDEALAFDPLPIAASLQTSTGGGAAVTFPARGSGADTLAPCASSSTPADRRRRAAASRHPSSPTSTPSRAGAWLRTNFVSTLDGSGVGPDGRSGSINTPADNRVFALQRDLCDAVLVGSGTVRAEGYQRVTPTRRRATPPALVVVSGSGRVPEGLQGPVDGRGDGLLVTCAGAGPRALDRRPQRPRRGCRDRRRW